MHKSQGQLGRPRPTPRVTEWTCARGGPVGPLARPQGRRHDRPTVRTRGKRSRVRDCALERKADAGDGRRLGPGANQGASGCRSQGPPRVRDPRPGQGGDRLPATTRCRTERLKVSESTGPVARAYATIARNSDPRCAATGCAWYCALESGTGSRSHVGRHGSGSFHSWLFGRESTGVHGLGIAPRALQGASETGRPLEAVTNVAEPD
jgi:hypothetical protein